MPLWIVLFILLAPLCSAQLSSSQKAIDFQQLAALFAKRYAFVEWKRDAIHFDGMDLKPWLDRIAQSKDDLEYFEICAEYAARYQDGHTGFELPSTYEAALGFYTDLYDGKVLIDRINRKLLPEGDYPFQNGDELVSIDGRPVSALLDSFSKGYGDGNARAVRRTAAVFLTHRLQAYLPRAHEVPDSSAIAIQRAGGAVETYAIAWQKSGEAYMGAGPVPTPTMSIRRAALAVVAGSTPRYMARTRSMQIMRSHNPRLSTGVGELPPVFALPANFVQRLGSGRYDNFFTGVFKTQDADIGYIRIPDFEGFSQSAMLQEIKYLQQNTAGLIVDLMRNPGGYGCAAESLAGYFAPNGLRSVGNSVRVTWEYIQGLEVDLADATNYGATDAEIAEIERELDASRAAFGKNRGFTEPLPLCGLSQDLPPATDRYGNPVVYTKPVMLLVDDLSASAAEVFAAIMQDNHRAMLYGYRTDGAGGSVGGYPAGIYSETGASIAQSILIRANPIATTDYPSAPYIENIGIRPDTVDDYMTADNLVNKGAAFVNNFLKAMVDYINSKN